MTSAPASEGILAPLDSHADPAAGERLSRALEAVGMIFQPGNEIEVLRNGKEIFTSMLEAIENAEENIEFVTFIYWQGDIARTFAELLAARSKAGVRVRVILDAWGSRPMNPERIEIMTRAGVQVERFRPVMRLKFWESDHRTHRKILVTDGKIGFTGGVGIAKEWEGDARHPGEWRDTHFKLTGPAVLGLRAAFFSDGETVVMSSRLSTSTCPVGPLRFYGSGRDRCLGTDRFQQRRTGDRGADRRGAEPDPDRDPVFQPSERVAHSPQIGDRPRRGGRSAPTWSPHRQADL